MVRNFVCSGPRTAKIPIPTAHKDSENESTGRSDSYTPWTLSEFRACPSRVQFFGVEDLR